jgi:hypothetical protein
MALPTLSPANGGQLGTKTYAVMCGGDATLAQLVSVELVVQPATSL